MVLKLNNIYNIDCVKGLGMLNDESVDFVLTSPPYDNVRQYNGFSFDFTSFVKQLYKKMKLGGVVVWVTFDGVVPGNDGGKTYSGSSLKHCLGFLNAGFNVHSYMIYRKKMFPISTVSQIRYYNRFEFMWILSKGRPRVINLIKDRKNTWQNHKWGNVNVRTKEGEIKKLKNGSDITDIEPLGVRDNIWTYTTDIPDKTDDGIWSYATGFDHNTKDEIAKEHPALMPEKLAHDQIITWSNAGDLVLDPLNGVGTTCKMAKLLGRKYIGFEISDKYCKMAKERLNMHPTIDEWC